MSDKYKKYSQIEHVLARPGMYIGDTKNCIGNAWIYTPDGMKNIQGEWNPGIYKLFDEILTNASDEVQRNKSVNTIKVKIEDDKISVYNNSGIPIELHSEYNIYIPELIKVDYAKQILHISYINGKKINNLKLLNRFSSILI